MQDVVKCWSSILTMVQTLLELRGAIGKWNQAQINGALLQRGIMWRFNPPLASRHGGMGEKLIKPVCKVLNSTLRTHRTNEEYLHKVLCKAEAIIRKCPLTMTKPRVEVEMCQTELCMWIYCLSCG